MGTGLYKLYWVFIKSPWICADVRPSTAASSPTTSGCCSAATRDSVMSSVTWSPTRMVPERSTISPAGRGHLDVAHRRVGHRLGVGRSVEYLQVPQADEHEREHRRHEKSDDPQPHHGARRGAGSPLGMTRSTTVRRGRMRGVRTVGRRAGRPVRGLG